MQSFYPQLQEMHSNVWPNGIEGGEDIQYPQLYTNDIIPTINNSLNHYDDSIPDLESAGTSISSTSSSMLHNNINITNNNSNINTNNNNNIHNSYQPPLSPSYFSLDDKLINNNNTNQYNNIHIHNSNSNYINDNTENNINNNNNSNNLNDDDESPTSSCVSPTLIHDKIYNSHKYHLESQINSFNGIEINNNHIPVKQEIDDNKILENITPKQELNNINSSTKVKRGRVKKPMTLVQRKAHNKIERKYRININSKIANLQKLVPWMSEDGVAFEIDSKNLNNENNNNNQQNKKLNKSMILDMVTEYLLLLKDECRKKDNEIQDLKNQLNK